MVEFYFSALFIFFRYSLRICNILILQSFIIWRYLFQLLVLYSSPFVMIGTFISLFAAFSLPPLIFFILKEVVRIYPWFKKRSDIFSLFLIVSHLKRLEFFSDSCVKYNLSLLFFVVEKVLDSIISFVNVILSLNGLINVFI